MSRLRKNAPMPKGKKTRFVTYSTSCGEVLIGQPRHAKGSGGLEDILLGDLGVRARA